MISFILFTDDKQNTNRYTVAVSEELVKHWDKFYVFKMFFYFSYFKKHNIAHFHIFLSYLACQNKPETLPIAIQK